eukprot:jgi/Psemu1/3383/gm1.3383_g
MDQLSTTKNSNTPPAGNSNQQQQGGNRPRNRNQRGNNNNSAGGCSSHPQVASGNSLVWTKDSLLMGLKIVGGKKNSKVKTTLISMEPLTKDDFLPTMPSPADYTVLGSQGEEVVNPDTKRLLEQLWIKKGERATKNPVVKQHLKTNESWMNVEDDQDTLGMLKLLREYCYWDSATKVHPMVDAANKVYNAAMYAEEVKAHFDVMTSAGITIRSEDMIKLALKKGFPDKSYANYTKMDETSKTKIETLMEDMLLSVVIVNGCNTKTHRNLSGVLKDNYSLGSDVYPTSQPKALKLMNQYKSVARTTPGQQANNNGGSGVRRVTGNPTSNSNKGGDTANETALTTKGITTPATTGGSKVAEAHQILMAGVKDGAFDEELCFVQLSTPTVPHQTPEKSRSVGPHTVDSTTDYSVDSIANHSVSNKATCNCVSNPALLKDIQPHPEGRKVQIHCNPGMVLVDFIGELPGFGTVWYQEYYFPSESDSLRV